MWYGRSNSKYGNQKTHIDGHKFDSQLEAKFYLHLKDLKERGLISYFDMQVPFEIIPSYTSPTGKKIRATKYIADFVVYHFDGSREVFDPKGQETDVFKIKRKLFELKYNEPLICVTHKPTMGGWITLEELAEKRKAKKSSK